MNQLIDWVKNELYRQRMVKGDGYHQYSIDDADARVLEALHLHGRASWSAIGALAGCSAATAQRRFARLKDQGLVRIVGALNVQSIGLGVPVLVRAKCHSTQMVRLARRVHDRPEARFVATLAGSADCAAELVVAHHADLEWLMPDIFSDAGWETETFPILRTFTSAHDWSPLGGAGPVSPATVSGHSLDQPGDFSASAQLRRLTKMEEDIAMLLMQDGRTPVTDLASAVGTSESTAARALQSLLETNRFSIRVLVEPQLMGFTSEYLIWLSVAPDQLETAGHNLAQHSATKYLSSTAGRFNLVGQIVLTDHADMYEFVTDVLGSLPGVHSVDVTLQLNTYKRLWTPIVGVHIGDDQTGSVRVSSSSDRSGSVQNDG